jgi:hypothetical protein
MKTLFAVLAVLVITGCAGTPVQERGESIDLTKVDGFEDCNYSRVYVGMSHKNVGLHVIRCPNSSTTTRSIERNPVTTNTTSK